MRPDAITVDGPCEAPSSITNVGACVVSLILVIVAVMTRGRLFGSPVAHLDDQFYLLVGSDLLKGHWPYVSIWDRKPLGLFLIYAFIAAMPGEAVINVQIAASIFAVGTAFVIVIIGRRIGSPRGAILAGVAYLFMLPSLSGGSGQSPVFYNLFVAISGLLTFSCVQNPKARRPQPLARLVMLLIGFAIFVKPTAVFEGVYFALVLLRVVWVQTTSWSRLLVNGAQMLALALFPTLSAFIGYGALGHFQDLWNATFVSVIHKAPLPRPQQIGNLQIMLNVMTLVLGFAAASSILLWKRDRRAGLFMSGWTFFAIIGVISVPNFFDHYGLPLLVPLSAMLAPILSVSAFGPMAFSLVCVWATLWTPLFWLYDGSQRRARFEEVDRIVKANLHGGCLFVYEGPVQLYTSTGACRLTRFAFPDHLNSVLEEHALPVDQQDELRRVLRARPSVIAEANRIYLVENAKSRAILNRELRCNYRMVASQGFGTRFPQSLRIWSRDSDRAACV